MSSIILLSIIQGISEFLPISSSFHLIVFRDIFLVGKEVLSSDIELTFDIALHFGTLLAILVYFYKDFFNMFKKTEKQDNSNILFNIIVATIPASVIGFLFDDFIELYIRAKYIMLITIFILTGIVIYLIDNRFKQIKSINKMNLKDALMIGLSQIFALIPGVSRSGITITTARLLKINREDSMKFSFFLSVPIIMGAVLLKLLKIDFNIIISYLDYFIVGIIISFLVGILCIKLLLKYIRNNNFKVFMIYRIVLGIVVLIYFLK